MSVWRGTPALCGDYKIENNDSGGLGDTSASSFTENAADWSLENFEPKTAEPGDKKFVVRCVSPSRPLEDGIDKFWENDLAETEDFEEARGECCFATLHHAARRMPLRLEWDELRELDEGNVFNPTACPCISLLEDEDGVQQAAALMTNCNDSSNSWISHRLKLSSALAFKTRQFSTPFSRLLC